MHKDKRIMNWQPFMNKVYNATSVVLFTLPFLHVLRGEKKSVMTAMMLCMDDTID